MHKGNFKNPKSLLNRLFRCCFTTPALMLASINIPLKQLDRPYLVHSKEQEVLSTWSHQDHSSKRQAVKKGRMPIKREQFVEYKFSYSHMIFSGATIYLELDPVTVQALLSPIDSSRRGLNS